MSRALLPAAVYWAVAPQAADGTGFGYVPNAVATFTGRFSTNKSTQREDERARTPQTRERSDCLGRIAVLADIL